VNSVVSTLAESVTVDPVLPVPSEAKEAAKQAEGSKPADKGDPLRTFFIVYCTYIIIPFLVFLLNCYLIFLFVLLFVCEYSTY
jgi:hypothetical protein